MTLNFFHSRAVIKANLPPRADWEPQQNSAHWSPSETWLRSVKKSHLESQQSDLVAFGFQWLAASAASGLPAGELPLIVLWNSCGKIPLGASWWKIQRRNCLATPAALPGTIMLEWNRERKGKQSWKKQHELEYLFTYLFRVRALTHQSSHGISHCYFHQWDEMF